MHLHPFLCIYTGSQNGCKCRKMGARLQKWVKDFYAFFLKKVLDNRANSW